MSDDNQVAKPPTPTIWFRAENEIFDPRAVDARGLHRQIYVRQISAVDGVSLSKDASGVFISIERNGFAYEHFVPYSGVRQCLNVKDRGKTK